MMYFGYILLGCIIAFLSAAYKMVRYPPGARRISAMINEAGMLVLATALGMYLLPSISSYLFAFSITILLCWNIFNLKNFVHKKI